MSLEQVQTHVRSQYFPETLDQVLLNCSLHQQSYTLLIPQSPVYRLERLESSKPAILQLAELAQVVDELGSKLLCLLIILEVIICNLILCCPLLGGSQLAQGVRVEGLRSALGGKHLHSGVETHEVAVYYRTLVNSSI